MFRRNIFYFKEFDKIKKWKQLWPITEKKISSKQPKNPPILSVVSQSDKSTQDYIESTNKYSKFASGPLCPKRKWENACRYHIYC